MVFYTLIAAFVALVAGFLIAVCTRRAEGVVYGRLDKAGRITNIVLLLIYLCLAPLYIVLGMFSYPNYGGLLGILGWVVSFINASAALFCSLGLGLSVALRKKGKSKASFAVQFAGLAGIVFTVLSYIVFSGNLLAPIE